MPRRKKGDVDFELGSSLATLPPDPLEADYARQERATRLKDELDRLQARFKLDPPQQRQCTLCSNRFVAAWRYHRLCHDCIQKHHDAEDAAARARDLLLTGLHGRLLGMTLASFDRTRQPDGYRHVVEFASAFPRIPTLLLVGDSGTGKTHLAAGLILELFGRSPRVPGRYCHVPSVVMDWSASGDYNATLAAAAVAMSAAPVLVLEDLDGTWLTPKQMEIFARIIVRRSVSELPTLVTSHEPERLFSASIGVPAWRRLTEGGRDPIYLRRR